MLTVAIFFKRLADAKSRLASVLSPLERATLARRMLLHVIDAARKASGVAEVAVVSPEAKIAEIIGRDDVSILRDPGPDGFNAAAGFALAALAAGGKPRALLLPADLPRMGPEHIEALIKAHARKGADTIVASKDGFGTNALLIELPPRFPLAFGPDSFNRHLANAAHSSRRLHVHRCAHIGTDIDGPDDLRELPPGMIL
ncbi:MAG TPA: 2-phospho-L-lactate guanylyltransferase [Sphingomicrobium sp.]|nr:2-phospho-L-lactate guanylyltransferase [Sphingomicrobium sp.]